MRLSSDQPKSIIVLQSRDAPLRVSQALETAQHVAQKASLPCAVVARYDKGDVMSEELFAQLEKFEHLLSRYNIPLILMFGSSVVVLKALERHFKPDLYETDSVPGVLVRHKISWPWPVQSVASLRTYIAKVGIEGVCEL